MRRLDWLLVMAIFLLAATALAAEASKEPPPTWPWPGPTPSAAREAWMKTRVVFQPTAAELKKIEDAAPNKPEAPPARPRKLLVWGRVWRHLGNVFTEEAVRILGRKTGAFQVVTDDDPQLLLPERRKEFDAIFLTGLHDPNPFLPPWDLKTMPPDERRAAVDLDQRVKQSLLQYVSKEGKGIAAIEGAICALRDWKEFGDLMGAFYNGHYVGNFVIKVEDPSHPLTACLGGQPLRLFDQAYVPGPPYSRKNLRVLLSLDMTQTADPLADPKMAWLKPAVEKLEASTGRAKEYPISWVKPYGKGRVFYCSLGVHKPAYFNPIFLRYLLGGIQFALGDLPGDTTPSER